MIQNLRIACLLGIHFLILAHIYIFGDKIIGSVDFQEFFHSFFDSWIGFSTDGGSQPEVCDRQFSSFRKNRTKSYSLRKESQ